MSLLLDTHALIWFLENNPRLPISARNRIEATEIVFASIASIWEIAIKINIGKLTLTEPFEAIEANLTAAQIALLPITFDDTQSYLSLPLHHRDPFDRILISQAINHSLTLVSQDIQMDSYAIDRLWESDRS